MGQTVFFRHKYLTQPIITPTDAILRATQDLCDVLKGKRIVKGETRSAVDMRVVVFKGYKGEPTNTNKHQEKTKKAALNKKNQKRS